MVLYMPRGQEGEKMDRHLAIIAPQLPVIHRREIALLVAVKEKFGNCFYVETLHRVWIKEVDDPEKTKNLKNDFLKADRDSWSWGEIISEEDYWCVDGPEAPEPDIEPLQRRFSWWSSRRRT